MTNYIEPHDNNIANEGGKVNLIEKIRKYLKIKCGEALGEMGNRSAAGKKDFLLKFRKFYRGSMLFKEFLKRSMAKKIGGCQ